MSNKITLNDGNSQTRRILILGQELAASEATVDFLRHLGHEVAMVEDVQDAMMLAEKLRPDVLVCDLAPEAGQERFTAARKIMKRFGSALVVISNYRQTVLHDHFPEFDDAIHLRKPISLEQLDRSVTGLTGKSGD